MKFILASLAALAISTPAVAQHNYHRQHQHNHHRHGSWVAPAIIGAIGTAIIIDQYGRQRQVVVDNNPPVIVSSTPPVVYNPPVVVHNPPVVVHNPVATCTDWREVQDEYGRIYRERFCRN